MVELNWAKFCVPIIVVEVIILLVMVKMDSALFNDGFCTTKQVESYT